MAVFLEAPGVKVPCQDRHKCQYSICCGSHIRLLGSKYGFSSFRSPDIHDSQGETGDTTCYAAK
jgi:hypothetical protein